MARESLVPETTKKETSNEQSQDRVAAGKLLTILKRNNRIRSAKISIWEKSFRLLRRVDGKTQEQINDALQYLGEHIDDDYCPIITNGRQFREKFPKLERIMSRDITTITITPKAQAIVDNVLSKLHWPKDSMVHLAAVTQKTMNNYAPFKEKLDRMQMFHQHGHRPTGKEELQKHEMVRRFLTFLMDNYFTGVQFFTMMWMQEVHKKIKWPGWSGTIVNMEFREDSPLLVQLGHQWANSFCVISTRWEMLIEELKQMEKKS